MIKDNEYMLVNNLMSSIPIMEDKITELESEINFLRMSINVAKETLSTLERSKNESNM